MAGQDRRGIVVLAGGFGGSKMSDGIAQAAGAGRPVSIVVNTGDDLELHGLTVCPDLDTVLYTLTGWANDATGWGVRDETWSAKEMLGRYGAPTWFGLGDRDLATHLVRTQALRAGERLTTVTGRLADALGAPVAILPMCDEPVRTELRSDGEWLAFQEYFVHRHHAPPVAALRRVGIEAARPTPEVLAALEGAALVVLAPSNPFVSIGTILAVPGMEAAIRAAGVPVVAVSPIVGGGALRGPADRMLETIEGREATAAAVVAHYRARYPGLVTTYVIDERDAALLPAVRAGGPEPVLVLDTVMTDRPARARLARAILDRLLPTA